MTCKGHPSVRSHSEPSSQCPTFGDRIRGVSERLPDAARFGNGSALTPTRVHTAGGEHAEGCSGQGGDPADEDWGADADRVGDRPEDQSADRCGADKEHGLYSEDPP